MTEIRTASSSSEVFLSMATVNAKLLDVASRVMGVTEADAAKQLQQKMMLPVRKPAKGMALVVVYQYVKPVVWHLNSSLSAISVTTFVKRTHAIKCVGSWISPSPTSTRRVLKQSPDEFVDLLRADAFIKDSFGRMAMLDALANFIDELDGTASMVSWTGPTKATRVIRCLFGHVANVSFRVSWATLFRLLHNRCYLSSPFVGCACVPDVHVWMDVPQDHRAPQGLSIGAKIFYGICIWLLFVCSG